MSIDVLLHVVNLALFPSLMTALGIYVAIKDIPEKGQKWGVVSMFGVLFILTVIFASLSEIRSYKAQDKRDGTIDNMYGRLTHLIDTVTHPPLNIEHQQLSAALNAIQQKLKVRQVQPPIVSAVTPTEVPHTQTLEEALHKKTNQELKEYAINLANKMRDFETSYKKNSYTQAIANPIRTVDREEMRRQWDAMNAQSVRDSLTHENEYQKTFWADALAIYTALIDRLRAAGQPLPRIPGMEPGGTMFTLSYGSLSGATPVENVANYLEVLARALPLN